MDIARASRRLMLVTSLSLVTMGVVAAPGATAKDGDVIRTGSCTGATDWKLKLSKEDGRIEVEFEVDQNRNGVRWTVTLFRNGTEVARRVRVTRGPSGSFEARFVTANRPGADRFLAKAARVGERCSARASFA
jgi:hypothetical protein